MKTTVLCIFLFVSIALFGQRDRRIDILGSYQPYDLQIASLGVVYGSNLSWPFPSLKLRLEGGLRGQWYLDHPSLEEGDYYGFRYDVYFTKKFVGLGFQNRMVFHDGRSRYEVGPTIKAGYKFIWLEYTASFMLGDHPFDIYTEDPNLPLSAGIHNVNLIISIPILKFE